MAGTASPRPQPHAAEATLAFWLPTGAGNFLHTSADRPLLDALQAKGPESELRVGHMEWWTRMGFGIPTPSSSVLSRTVFAASIRGWEASATVRNTRGHKRPEQLIVRVAHQAGRLTLGVDSDGLHRWSLDGGDAEALDALLTDFLGTPARNADHDTDWYGLGTELTGGDIYVEHDDDGYLPFFQLNMLLGGLFNPAFIPAVFLESQPNVRRAIPPLTLHTLIRKLSIVGFPATESDAEVRVRALRRFLDVSFEEGLKPLKWRLERVRRALLGSMLGVIHRKTQLTQLRERLTEQESFDSANESQLRGFVMLVSSKLAILQNVQGHVGATIDSSSNVSADLAERGSAWNGMLDAIADNVSGLETLIHHAWMDRTLYEQEQLRSEQEALAEIERVRGGENRLGTNAEALAVIALIPAVAGVVVAGSGGGGSGSGLNTTSVLVGSAVTLVALLSLGGWLLWRRLNKGDPRLFYELNLRLNARVRPAEAVRLLGMTRRRDGAPGPVRLSGMRRGSVRIEQVSNEVAIFKIHVDGKIVLPRHSRFSLRRRRVPVHTICELFHHQPSEFVEYIFRQLRVICPAGTSLEPASLRAMTIELAEFLVDPFISGESVAERIREGRESSAVIFRVVEP